MVEASGICSPLFVSVRLAPDVLTTGSTTSSCRSDLAERAPQAEMAAPAVPWYLRRHRGVDLGRCRTPAASAGRRSPVERLGASSGDEHAVVAERASMSLKQGQRDGRGVLLGVGQFVVLVPKTLAHTS